MSRGLVYIASGICLLGFPAAVWLAFVVAPLQDQLYANQKIFYFHVPAAFCLFLGMIVCGIASIGYLRKRSPGADRIAQAGGELAVLFGAIVLISGSIWAKAAWGQWWTWEARLTTSLLFWMVMVSYLLARKYGGPAAERLSAGLGVFGMASVPLIYGSVNLWRTMHPKTTAVPGLQGDMRIAFWCAVLTFLALFYVMLRARAAQLLAGHELTEARELALDTGLIE